MADKPILKAKRIYLDGDDISSESNSVNVTSTLPEVASTSFADEAQDAEPGIEQVSGTVGIMLPVDLARELAHSEARGETRVLTFFAEGNELGHVAYTAAGLSTQHSLGAQVGALLGLTVQLASRGVPLLRGLVAEAAGERTATGNGGDVEISGGVPEGRRLYVIAHLVELEGFTGVTVAVESDVDDTYSAPETRVTLPQLTEPGAALAYVLEEITDEHFRLTLTAAGAGPGSFRVAATLAVL